VLEHFPRAVFHGSLIGRRHNLDRRQHAPWAGYIDHGFADCLGRLEAEGRFRAEDNAEIAPGIRTLYLGGRSICSQAVCAVTDEGLAVITGDDVYRFDLLKRGCLARLHTTPEALMRSTDALTSLVLDADAILLPVHDPVLWEHWEREGDAWLRPIRALSVAAAEGYVRRRDQHEVRVVGVGSK